MQTTHPSTPLEPATQKKQLFTENLPYPSGRVMQMVYKSPIWLYRLGLGPLVGRLFMILTTTGRKSGLPRRTAIEFHQRHGRKYVMVGWTAANWYKNILTNPLVTIQTAWGTEHARARRITTIEDLRGAWEVAEQSSIIRGIVLVVCKGDSLHHVHHLPSQSITDSREDTYSLPKQQPFAFARLDSFHPLHYNVVSRITTYL